MLRLEELPDRPPVAWHFADSGSAETHRPWPGPVRVLSYEVLIHVDQVVIDFRPPPAAVPPQCHSFKWWLGFRDD
jgi:hypothetical protein